MRKRNRSVSIRLTDQEFEELQARVEESGLTQQAFMIQAFQETPITTKDELSLLKDISSSLATYEKQLRGIATNVNQMARVANSTGTPPSENTLHKLYEQIKVYRKEGDDVWLLIRLLIAQRKAALQ